jgi:hypothetical protein
VSRAGIAVGLAAIAGAGPVSATGNETIPSTPLEPRATAAVEAWLRTPDPVLVILVLDGLRRDALEALAPDTSPLMPHLRSLADSSLAFADCLTGSPEPALGLAHLLTGKNAAEALRRIQDPSAGTAPPGEAGPSSPGLPRLAALGFELHGLDFRADFAGDSLLTREFPWLRRPFSPPLPPQEGLERASTEIAAMQTSLADALGRRGPTVLVWIPDLLLPPFVFPDRWLAACDPTPWLGGQRVVSAEELRRTRLLRARRVAEVGVASLLDRGAAKDSNEPLWLVDTAHALADSLLGDLLAELTAPSTRDRIGLIVTATHGTSLRGPEALRGPLDPGRTRVPLLLHVPGIAAGTELAPVLLGDVATTLVRRVDRRASLPAGAVDWADPIAPGRERWSFAWNLGPGPRERPVAAVRLTTSELVYREKNGRRGLLFDLRTDPDETENLASVQGELAQTLSRKVRAALCGSRPEIWLVAKNAPGPDRTIEGTLSVAGTVNAVEPIDLEPDDVITSGATIRFRLGGAPGLDGLRVRLEGDPSLRLTMRATPGPRWPVTAGSHALPGRTGTWNLTFPDAALVGALTRSPPADLATWAADLESGLHLLIVADGDASLLSP